MVGPGTPQGDMVRGCQMAAGLGSSWGPQNLGRKQSAASVDPDSPSPKPSLWSMLETIVCVQIDQGSVTLGFCSSLCRFHYYKGDDDNLILLELDPQGQGRESVCFGEGQTFTHLNSLASKISGRMTTRVLCFLALSCPGDHKCSQGHLLFCCAPGQACLPRRFKRCFQKALRV